VVAESQLFEGELAQSPDILGDLVGQDERIRFASAQGETGRDKGAGAVFDTALIIPYSQDMPRPRRAAEGGLIYQALNRANARLAIFQTDEDYAAFQRVLAEAVECHHMRLLAYCLMPNHFHVLLQPRDDGTEKRRRNAIFTEWRDKRPSHNALRPPFPRLPSGRRDIGVGNSRSSGEARRSSLVRRASWRGIM
jgi:hypothetical protein